MTNNPIMHLSDGVTLKDYIDTRFSETQRALDKAEATMAARLATMNEFREQLRDQASRFITRSEAEIKHDSMCKQIDDLRSLADVAKGKASQTALLYTALLSLAGLILGLIHLFRGT